MDQHIINNQAYGYIKLYRSLKKYKYYKDSCYVHLWIHLLMNARRHPKQIDGITVQPGQILTGRKKLAQETGISESKIQRILAKLVSEQQVKQHTTNKYRLITISNWPQYQQHEHPTEQQESEQHYEQYSAHQTTRCNVDNTKGSIMLTTESEQKITQQSEHITRKNNKTTTTTTSTSYSDEVFQIFHTIEKKFQHSMPAHNCLPFIQSWLNKNLTHNEIYALIDEWLRHNIKRVYKCYTLEWIHKDLEQLLDSQKVITDACSPKVQGQTLSKPFETFWQLFPSHSKVGKGSKKAAYRIFCKLIKSDTTPDDIIDGVKQYKQYIEQENRYNKHAVNWLKNEDWKHAFDNSNNNIANTTTYDADLAFRQLCITKYYYKWNIDHQKQLFYHQYKMNNASKAKNTIQAVLKLTKRPKHKFKQSCDILAELEIY